VTGRRSGRWSCLTGRWRGGRLRVSVMERRGVAVDSVAVVRDCVGYSRGGMKKGASSCAWRVKRLHGGHVEQAWQRREAGMVGTAAARHAVTLCAVRRRRLSETDWVGTVALDRAQFVAQYHFAII
jgi:hypothetical protein